MFLHTAERCRFCGSERMAGRPLAVGAAGGGIVSILSQIVLDHLKEPYPFLPDPRDRFPIGEAIGGSWIRGALELAAVGHLDRAVNRTCG